MRNNRVRQYLISTLGALMVSSVFVGAAIMPFV